MPRAVRAAARSPLVDLVIHSRPRGDRDAGRRYNARARLAARVSWAVVGEVETAPRSGIISNPAKIRATAARDTASVAPKPYWYPPCQHNSRKRGRKRVVLTLTTADSRDERSGRLEDRRQGGALLRRQRGDQTSEFSELDRNADCAG